MNAELFCHPSAPPKAVSLISVQIEREGPGLRLIYTVEGDPARLLLPPETKPYRADGLWQTTCFELFVRCRAQAYRELNLSPSGQWSAYDFEAYREGMEPLGVDDPPAITIVREPFGIMLIAWVGSEFVPSDDIGLSAIIEETDGTRSYWALAHPPEGPPDFHHPDCFALTLPAPGSP